MQDTQLDRDEAPSSLADRPWVTIVWDDPVNLMHYVTFVFERHFGFARSEAERRMMQVHTEGRAIVASGAKELQELHVQAMHEYGLQATLEQSPA